MGINIILPLIMGIAMTVIIGSQVAPSFIEQMKVAKVENRTISNQNLIKDAIVRYIKLEKKVPKDNDLEVLNKAGLLMDYHESNLFGGGYGFKIDKKKGILKIFTTINDEDAGKYFSNSFKFPNAPTCIEFDQNNACTGKFETFYLLDEETFKSIPIPEVGSIEDIQDRFTKVEEVGKKFDEATLVGGKKDYIVDIPNNEVTEYVYVDNEWKPNPNPINVGGFGKDTNVFVSNEKVHCKDTTPPGTDGFEVFVVNENTGLGEIVWVAPDDVLEIQRKIFDPNLNSVWTKITTEPIFEPNNICTSKVTSMLDIFYNKQTFNKPLNRWDTSNVTDMDSMFTYAYKFNNNIGEWDVSNVTNMYSMFSEATSFNQPLNNWNVSKVTNMDYMFLDAWEFNQPLNNWNVSNVTSMDSMFEEAYSFNQPLNNWDVSNVTYMDGVFNWAEKFNQPLNNWDVSNVTYMGYMFYGATIFNQDISNWDVSKVTDMYKMFDDAQSFNKDLSSWCVSQIALKPYNFDNKANAWILPKPKWGEPCPPNP